MNPPVDTAPLPETATLASPTIPPANPAEGSPLSPQLQTLDRIEGAIGTPPFPPAPPENSPTQTEQPSITTRLQAIEDAQSQSSLAPQPESVTQSPLQPADANTPEFKQSVDKSLEQDEFRKNMIAEIEKGKEAILDEKMKLAEKTVADYITYQSVFAANPEAKNYRVLAACYDSSVHTLKALAGDNYEQFVEDVKSAYQEAAQK